jgi:CDP-paratose 2-epimerase
MKYIVTGSLGLVGLASCKRLLEEGHEVVGIDCNAREEFFGKEGSTNSKLNTLSSYANYKHYAVDIADKNSIDKVFNEGFDRVIHTAAQPSHDWATNNIHRDFEINAVGSINIFNAVFKFNKTAPIAHISTSKVYGDNPNRLPLEDLGNRLDLPSDHNLFNGLKEDFSIDNCLHSFFGCSKVAGDLYAQEYGRHFGLKIGIFRPGCVTGSDHAGVPLHGFLSYLAKCIKNNIEYTVIGYEGKQVRCNIHADDLVDACITFLNNPKSGEIYNTGGRQLSCSIIEAVSALENLLDKKAKLNYNPTSRTGDHRWYISDMNKFKKAYNWNNKKSLTDIYKELCK